MVPETRRVCRALRPVSWEEGILETEMPTGCSLLGPTHRFGPDFSYTGGWDKLVFYNLSILHLQP